MSDTSSIGTPTGVPLDGITIVGALDAQQTAMTLSAIAYEKPDQVQGLLTEYAPGWQLSWGPAVSLTNLMYGAWNAGLNSYAVVIRGAEPCDVREVFDVSHQVPWQYPPTGDASISAGADEGLNDLLGLRVDGVGLLDWITSTVLTTSPTAALVVTGHSLGGGLASVLAPYLVTWLADLNVAQALHVYTFAAPTAGNAAFAALSAQAGSINNRVYNDLDVVPLAFGDLQGMKTIYEPTYACPDSLKLWIDFKIVEIGAYTYVQPPTVDYALSGTLCPGSDYLSQVLWQHHHNTYLWLLGAPPVGSESGGACPPAPQ